MILGARAGGPLAIGLMLIVGLTRAARADDTPVDARLGLTLNPTFGYHESFNDRVRVPPVPAPLLEASIKRGRFEVFGIGLPPTVAIPYTDAIQGRTNIRLTTLDLTGRFYTANRRFSVGIGETLYNQRTHYQRSTDIPNTSEEQYSRVVGAHLELMTHLPFRAGILETQLRYAPTLLGTQVTTYGGYAAQTKYDPERGQQIDGSVRYIRALDRNRDVILGVRYINYTARYDVPRRPLSDRNVGILPTFGYRFRIGR